MSITSVSGSRRDTRASRDPADSCSSRCARRVEIDQRHRHRILIEGDVVDGERVETRLVAGRSRPASA